MASPFELRLNLFGHGWVALPPHRFDEANGALHTVLRLDGAVFDAVLTQAAPTQLELRLDGQRRATTTQRRNAVAQVRHALRLDDDLAAFHALCATTPRLAWAARRGAGRLLRSPTVIEDLLKLLFTTNTTWAGTVAMVTKLVTALGEPAPSGARAFPTAAQCVQPVGFYRDTVRAGYRAEAAVALAQAFASGELDDATFLRTQPAAELWQRLLSLRGFGPYAAGQEMRLLGHYEQLALDSWCRARLAAMAKRRTPPSDAAIARRYAPFAPFQGLAMWLELTADWHGEGG